MDVSFAIRLRQFCYNIIRYYVEKVEWIIQVSIFRSLDIYHLGGR